MSKDHPIRRITTNDQQPNRNAFHASLIGFQRFYIRGQHSVPKQYIIITINQSNH